MIGVGLRVDLGDRALLGADHAGEVAEVVDRQRDVGVERLTHRLAVLPALGDGEHLQVGLHRIGHRVEHRGALGRRAPPPRVLGGVRGIDGPLDVDRGGVRDLADRLAGDGAEVHAVAAAGRRDPLAADEVVVTRCDVHRAAGGSRGGEGDGALQNGHVLSSIALKVKLGTQAVPGERGHGVARG